MDISMSLLLAQVDKLASELDRRTRQHRLLESYYDGMSPFPVAITAAKVTQAYRRLMPVADAPWGSLIVGSVLDRLEVGGIRDVDNGAADGAWGCWQENHMDSESKLAHESGLLSGRAFALVWPDEDSDNDGPEISLDTSEQMVVQYEEGSRHKRRAALRRWLDADTGLKMATLYLPGGIYKFQEPARDDKAQGNWMPRLIDGEEWPVANPFNVVPVVEIRFNTRLKPGVFGHARGEYAHCLGLIDRINLLTFLGLVVAFWMGFPIRAVIGDKILRDDDGNVLAPFTATADSVVQFEDPAVKLDNFPAADRQNLLIYPELSQLAAITKTPRHYFPLAQAMANLPLAVDTIVPTPSGRTTMGDLKAGDTVYAPDGSDQKVLDVLPIRYGRDCYRMVFDDGTEIVADSEHKWETTHFTNPSNPYGPREPRRETSVLTTEQIAGSLKTSMGTFNHFIPVARALEGPELQYPIAPHALGIWLGDGARATAQITAHISDAESTAELLRACGETVSVYGYPVADETHKSTRIIGITNDKEKCRYGHSRGRGTKHIKARCVRCDELTYRHRRYGEPMPEKVNETFLARLKHLGVWKNKHIPEQYFHGSVEQRLALLQGIMDTDGTVGRDQGSVAITLHDERLAHDVHRLAQTLGHKVKLRKRTWRTRGGSLPSVRASEGECWRMSWTPPHIVFRMERKAQLQRLPTEGGDGKSSKPFRRYIVSCERTASVPVRCINVSGAAHTFLVTDACVTTHNSADAIRADEGALAAKVTGHKASAGEGWEEVLRLCGQMMNVPLSPRAELVWLDHESRSLAERADAATKLASIMPWQVLAEQVLNATQDEIARWEALRSSDALSQLIAAAKQPIAPPVAASNGQPAPAPAPVPVPAAD